MTHLTWVLKMSTLMIHNKTTSIFKCFRFPCPVSLCRFCLKFYCFSGPVCLTNLSRDSEKFTLITLQKLETRSVQVSIERYSWNNYPFKSYLSQLMVFRDSYHTFSIHYAIQHIHLIWINKSIGSMKCQSFVGFWLEIFRKYFSTCEN